MVVKRIQDKKRCLKEFSRYFAFFLYFLPFSFPKRDEKELKNSQAILIMAVNYTLLRKKKYLDLWVHDFPTKTKFLQFLPIFKSLLSSEDDVREEQRF